MLYNAVSGIETKQDKANVKITCAGLEECIIVRANINEKVSEPFQIDVVIQTKSAIDTAKLVNKDACITISLPDNTNRYFAGIVGVASLENVPSSDKNVIRASNIVCLKIIPTIFKTSLTKKYRIFQDITVVEIIETILKENGVSKVKKNVTSAAASQNKRIFCVQYNESDLNFISRLMEEEGIHYYFTHEQDGDTFCFSDSSTSAKKITPSLNVQKDFHERFTDMNAVYNLSMSETFGIKTIHSMSFNEDKFATISGKAVNSNAPYNIGELEFYDPVFDDSSSGDSVAKNILERENRSIKFMSGNSACPNMSTGSMCNIRGSNIESQNGDFFVIELRHTINQITTDNNIPFYENKFKIIPGDTNYRPVFIHQKQRIFGIQTATVTGASGEEIFCDEKGRIKVRFHWDSRSQLDDKSSCWIRVAQSWAGKNFGGLVIPRVGMEVLVTFINGDPDQPLVTGCVYNGVNKAPSDYPTTKKTASTFFTDSSKGSEGFNELRFDDAKDKEEIYVHAQKDVNVLVEDSVTETLNYGSKTVTLESQKDKVKHITLVKKGDHTTTINEGDMSVTLDKGNSTITLTDGNKTITLSNGNLKIDITGDIAITAHNIKIDASKNIDITAGGTFSVTSTGKMQYETKDRATFNTTKDFIVNSAMNTKISANMNINIEAKMNFTGKANANITIESSAVTTLKAGAMMNVNGGGSLVLAAGMIKLN